MDETKKYLKSEIEKLEKSIGEYQAMQADPTLKNLAEDEIKSLQSQKKSLEESLQSI